MNIVGNALNELYRCFGLLNDYYFGGQLDEPVITIQKSKGGTMGYFTVNKVWRDKNDETNEEISFYEINVVPRFFNLSTTEICHTLCHEMVHYANKVSGIKDCNGQKHNKKFRNLAEKCGMICENDSKVGWGATTPTEQFIKFVEEEIKPNEDAFLYFRKEVIVQKEKKPRKKNIIKYICPQCGTDAKAKRDKHLICGDCNCEMEMEDDEE